MIVLTIFSTLFVLIAITRPFTVLFHELGHGIPALLLTKDKVTLYIGSHGDPNKSLNFRVGRLEFFFKYNPFLWKLGLCVTHSNEVTISRQMVITVFGPITSLLLGALCFYGAFAADLHGGIKTIAIALLGSSVMDFFMNIIPRDEPIRLHDGSIVYNDGQQLKQLYKYRTLPSQYTVGVGYYKEKAYEKAAMEFQNIIDSGLKSNEVYQLAISAYVQTKNYTAALAIHNEFEKYGNLNSDDYASSGFFKAQLGIYAEGVADFQKALDLNPENEYVLVNKAYTLILHEQYELAIADFDKAIANVAEPSYSLSNRGLSKIKLGQITDGLKDIEESLELDHKNSYAFRNLGIYNYDTENFEQALAHFEKARELDAETHLLNDYIEKTEKQIKMASTPRNR